MRAHRTKLATRSWNDETSYVASAMGQGVILLLNKYRKFVCTSFYNENVDLLLVVYTELF